MMFSQQNFADEWDTSWLFGTHWDGKFEPLCIHVPDIFWFYIIWVNYNDPTATSLEIMVNKGNHPKMALIQVSEIL